MRRPLVVFLVGTVTLLACSCPPSAPAEPEAAPSLDSAVTCKAVDADYKPIEETTRFYPDETFHCSVAVSNLEAGSMVRAEWFYGDESLGEYTYTADAGGSGHVGFYLEPAEAWAIGDYTVDVYLDDELRQTVSFSVVSPG